jgi:spore germination protein PB
MNAINKVVKKMNFYVQQSITIQYLKVNAVTNSSVLQIGSSGIIKPTTHLYNTGGHTGPAPQIQSPIPITAPTQPFMVPLTSPTA